MSDRGGYEGPGIYRHYKGGTYTVLFLAEEVVDEARASSLKTKLPTYLSVYVLPNDGRICCSRGHLPAEVPGNVQVCIAEDRTNKCNDLSDYVIYVSHKGHGIHARKLTEFNEYVEMNVSRFVKVVDFGSLEPLNPSVQKPMYKRTFPNVPSAEVVSTIEALGESMYNTKERMVVDALREAGEIGDASFKDVMREADDIVARVATAVVSDVPREGMPAMPVVGYDGKGGVTFVRTFKDLPSDDEVSTIESLGEQVGDAKTRLYFKAKDEQFAEQKRTGKWPSDTCESCKVNKDKRGDGASVTVRCCQFYSHHHLDCCLHCGNDERDPKMWKFR